MFISFEGVDGVGKSTQVKRISQYLWQNNIPNIQTREPGGCETAERIRELFLSEEFLPLSELMLMTAARHEHVNKTIKPALQANRFVLCDRFIDSMRVYQHLAGVDQQTIEFHINMAVGDTRPDLTFVLDMDTKLLEQRIKNREHDNKYDNFALDNLFDIRQMFLGLAKKNPFVYKVIDANQTEDAITNDITNYIQRILY